MKQKQQSQLFSSKEQQQLFKLRFNNPILALGEKIPLEKDILEELSLHFKKLELLGFTNKCVVVKGQYLQNKREYAIKIALDNINLLEEANIMMALRHQNIVMFKKMLLIQNRVCIVQECIRHGTLEKLISKRKKEKQMFTQKEIIKIIRNILLGIQYIHRKGYVHGDIKTMNILLADKSDLSKIKIIDFGICQKIDKEKKLDRRCGTLMYIAPEVVQKEGYGPPVDIWSTAIIMYKLFKLGKHPFLEGKETKKEIIDTLAKEELPPQAEKLKDGPQQLFELMTDKNQHQRISARNALKHPWLQQFQKTKTPTRQQTPAQIKKSTTTQLLLLKQQSTSPKIKFLQLIKSIMALNHINKNSFKKRRKLIKKERRLIQKQFKTEKTEESCQDIQSQNLFPEKTKQNETTFKNNPTSHKLIQKRNKFDGRSTFKKNLTQKINKFDGRSTFKKNPTSYKKNQKRSTMEMLRPKQSKSKNKNNNDYMRESQIINYQSQKYNKYKKTQSKFNVPASFQITALVQQFSKSKYSSPLRVNEKDKKMKSTYKSIPQSLTKSQFHTYKSQTLPTTVFHKGFNKGQKNKKQKPQRKKSQKQIKKKSQKQIRKNSQTPHSYVDYMKKFEVKMKEKSRIKKQIQFEEKVKIYRKDLDKIKKNFKQIDEFNCFTSLKNMSKSEKLTPIKKQKSLTCQSQKVKKKPNNLKLTKIKIHQRKISKDFSKQPPNQTNDNEQILRKKILSLQHSPKLSKEKEKRRKRRERKSKSVLNVCDNKLRLEHQKSVEQKINEFINHKISNIKSMGFYAYQRNKKKKRKVAQLPEIQRAQSESIFSQSVIAEISSCRQARKGFDTKKLLKRNKIFEHKLVQLYSDTCVNNKQVLQKLRNFNKSNVIIQYQTNQTLKSKIKIRQRRKYICNRKINYRK